MAWVIGVNCHLTLQHVAVDGGEAHGFVLDAPETKEGRGPACRVQRDTWSDGTRVTTVRFTVALAGRLVQPDGALVSTDPTAELALLLEYLRQENGVAVTLPNGVITGLGAAGHTVVESHYRHESVVRCQLTSAGSYFPPANPARYTLSVWDGTLSWAESYWR